MFSPCDVLLDGVGLDTELEAQLESEGLMTRDLLVHTIPEVQPQLFLLVATVTQAQVVILQQTQLLAHL